MPSAKKNMGNETKVKNLSIQKKTVSGPTQEQKISAEMEHMDQSNPVGVWCQRFHINHSYWKPCVFFELGQSGKINTSYGSFAWSYF